MVKNIEKENVVNGKVLGYADFGAFMHRDDGGKMKVAAYTSVNKPLNIEAHDETQRIAQRRYKIVEQERAELDGNKFYQKDVWNEQEDAGKRDTAANNPTDGFHDVNDFAQTTKPSSPAGDSPSALQVLKNFVDNLAADFRTDRTTFFWVAVFSMMLAVLALIMAIVAVST